MFELDNPFLKRKRKRKSKEPRKTTKGKGRNFRTVKEGAGMTSKGVKEYRRKNPGSKLKTAVTGKVKPGSKAAKRRKSFCARSKGWTGERGRAARRRWKCQEHQIMGTIPKVPVTKKGDLNTRSPF